MGLIKRLRLGNNLTQKEAADALEKLREYVGHFPLCKGRTDGDCTCGLSDLLQDYTFRSPQRDSWPAGRRELRERFERGDVPQRSLAMMDKRRGVGTCRVCAL